MAKDQPEYLKYPAALYKTEEHSLILLSRWQLSDEERERIAAGDDLFLGICTNGNPVQPVIMQVGSDGWDLPRPQLYVCPKCHQEFAVMMECKLHVAECEQEVAEEFLLP